MDVRMPGLNGIRATERIVACDALSTKVLVLTTFDADEYVYDALRVGATGFLLKDLPAEQLVDAIRQVARGSDALLAPSVTRRLVERLALLRSPPPATSQAIRDLTARELEVLRLMAKGLSNAEIAADLTVSDNTIKTHVARVLMKLEVRDRVQAVILAYESGLMNEVST
jgi:DNA-binding NarL/FixJ family response regulator